MPAFPDLDDLDPTVLVAVAVALVLVQTAFVVGFLVPGGKAAVLSGVMAGLGHVPWFVVYAGIASAAVIGAAIGFGLGRRFGHRLFTIRIFDKHRERLGRTQAHLRDRAPVALVGGRSIALFRATTPALAGASGVGTGRFHLWNLVGGLAWASATVGLGYLGGSTMPAVAEAAPRVVLILGTALVVVVLGVGFIRGRRGRPAAS